MASKPLPTPGDPDQANLWGQMLVDYLESMHGGYCNVKQYGAEGDGATDDTTAVVEAFDAAVANDQALYFPGGVYPVDGAIGILTRGVTVFGDSHGDSVIQWTDDTGEVLFDIQDDYCRIANLRIDATNNLGRAIRIGTYTSEGSRNAVIDHVYINNALYGIDHQYGWCNDFYSLQTLSCTTGVYIRYGNGLRFFANTCEGDDDGVHIDGGNSILFAGPVIEGGSGTGFIADSCKAIHLIDPYFESYDTKYLDIGSSGQVVDFRVLGGTFWGHGYDGSINFADVDGLIWEPGYIRDRLAGHIVDTASTVWKKRLSVDQAGQLSHRGALTIGYNLPAVPLFWWKLDDNAASTTVTDAMGNTNLTAQQNTSGMSVDGVVNEGFTFDGASDYASVGTAIVTGTQGSISCWINTNDNAVEQRIWASYKTGDNTHFVYFGIGASSHKLSLGWQDGGDQTQMDCSTTITEQQWYHVVVVSDGSSYKIYLNGVEETLTVASGANNGNWFGDVTGLVNWTIGCRLRGAGASYFWDGEIDDVRVFSEALTGAQVLEMYESEAEELRSNVTLYGSLTINDLHNVTADLTAFWTTGVHIIDSSGGAITGTLADGTVIGQTVKFVCKTAGNNIDITVAHHVTSDPEVIRLDTAKEWVELTWDGTDWVETAGNGQSYP